MELLPVIMGVSFSVKREHCNLGSNAGFVLCCVETFSYVLSVFIASNVKFNVWADVNTHIFHKPFYINGSSRESEINK